VLKQIFQVKAHFIDGIKPKVEVAHFVDGIKPRVKVQKQMSI
jgi:5'-3' exonuclease